MKRLWAVAAVTTGAAFGYLVAGSVMFGLLLVSNIDEDDERFLLSWAVLTAMLVLVGGVHGWRLWRRWSSAPNRR